MADVPHPDWVHPEWKPLRQSEYAELTVVEKHRHLLILASTFRRKAGFMTGKEGKPYNQAAWDKYTPLAEQTEAEAKRLSEQLISYKSTETHKPSAGFEQPVFNLHFMKEMA